MEYLSKIGKVDYNIIYNEECFEGMSKRIPDDSIDMLLTDPPYGTNDKYGKSIRRGKDDTNFDIDYDKETNLAFIEQLPRIMKNDRWGVIFVDRKEVTTFWQELERQNLSPRNTFYWIKPNKAPTPRSNFKSSVETAVVFTNGKTTEHWFGGGNQDNYFTAPFVTGRESVDVPAQKPVKLFRYLAKLFTEAGDTVLDPFIGSGTTVIACKALDRKYIGFEQDKKYYETAQKRINEVQKELI